jgi:hypothetical protein
MDIKLGSQITQYFHRISPLYQDTYQCTNQQLPSSLWTPLYNGHQTSVSNYLVISTEFDIHTRTLLNYGEIVCELVALSQWTPLYAGQHVRNWCHCPNSEDLAHLCPQGGHMARWLASSVAYSVSERWWPICDSGHLSIMDTKLQSHITQSFPQNLTFIPGHIYLMDKLTVVCPMVALSTLHLSIMDLHTSILYYSVISTEFDIYTRTHFLIMDKLTVVLPKLMKCRFALTYFYDLLTYLETIRAKVVMFGIKLKLMKCRFVLTYFYELLTYLNTIWAKVVMFGIKLKLVECKFELTYFYCLLLWPADLLNPLAPRQPISAANESQYIPRRLRDIVSRSIPETSVNKMWYYNCVSRCQSISSVECMQILRKLVYKVWPNFSLEFGVEIGYSRNYAQWHIIVRTWCIHSIQV